jgi:hypothetical protein
LRAHALSRGKTTAAVVREAVVALLDETGGPDEPEEWAGSTDAHSVKVTVRMGATHAQLLAHRARRVGVSQGSYMAGLLEGQPPVQQAVNHNAAVAALADSTQKLAAMSSDIRALIRLLSQGSTAEAEKYRSSMTSLSSEVRVHLERASCLVAELTASRSRAMRLTSGRSRRRAPST